MVHTHAHTHACVHTFHCLCSYSALSHTDFPHHLLPLCCSSFPWFSFCFHIICISPFPPPSYFKEYFGGGVLCIFTCTHMHVSVHPPALGIKPKVLYMLNTSSTTEIHPSSLLASVFSTPRTLVSLCWPWPTLESLPWPFFQSFYNQKRRLFLWHGLSWRWDSCQT